MTTITDRPTIPSPGSIEGLLPSWLRHLRAENLSVRTVDTHDESVRQLVVFLDQQDASTQITAVSQAQIEEWIGYLLEHRAAATANNRFRGAQQFFKWLVLEDELDESPMARMKPPRVPELPVPVIARDDLKKLLASCSGKTFEERRDHAILRVLVDTGARLAEVGGCDTRLALRRPMTSNSTPTSSAFWGKEDASGWPESGRRPLGHSIDTFASDSSAPTLVRPRCGLAGRAR